MKFRFLSILEGIAVLYFLAEHGSDPNNTWWGIVPILLVVVPLVFWFCAVVSIVRSGFGWGVKLLLVLAALAYPLIGPLLWFFAGRGTEFKTQLGVGRG
ncbi:MULTISPECIES: hypothetical protein [unclassified Corynebacterium]|uniref:hypothetical protein n=1 Tax=unclassified Corynebacterium TaxID=2624378 RepID=UPI0030C94BAC